MNGLFKKVFCVILILVGFSCSQQFRNHGYIPSEEELSIVSSKILSLVMLIVRQVLLIYIPSYEIVLDYFKTDNSFIFK